MSQKSANGANGVAAGSRVAAAAASIVVLKFGGSVLTREEDLGDVVHEIYRWVREGNRVVAVVSAFGSVTDRLLSQGERYGQPPAPGALAQLVATGESASAALLGLALDRAGVPAEVFDAARLALRTEGELLDSEPVSVDREALRAALERVPVVVVPGFLGRSEDGAQTLLGRGGSDLTALFLAQRLGARCRLVKDVPGLYERDPARPGPLARRFRSLHWDDALKLDGRIVQHKAIRFARGHELSFEVAALNRTSVTVVGPLRVDLAPVDEAALPPLRVGLLGLGTVGYGVYRNLQSRPDLFEITRISARDPAKHAENGVPRYLLAPTAAAVISSPCDVVVEAIGGVEPAKSLVEAALKAGKHVVTANKTLIAEHGEELESLARTNGVRLLASASVGGGAAILEAVRAAAGAGSRSPIVSIEAVLNGTSNVVLDDLATGASLAETLESARILGFTEADPSLDINGTDAADKLRILIRAAFSVSLPRKHVVSRGIDSLDPGTVLAEARAGRSVRLVARATSEADVIRASVAPEALERSHPLASTRREENRAIIRTALGTETIIRGRGAGRWPTAESVVADLLELARERSAADVHASSRLRVATAAKEAA